MKKIILSVAALSSALAQAQVGINEETPKATFEISVKKTNIDTDSQEGLLIPRVTKEKALKMANNNTTPPEESALIYVNDTNLTSPSNTTVEDITEKGFYFWNGVKWVKSAGSSDGNEAIWVKDGEDSKLAYPSSNYTTKYKANGGYDLYEATGSNTWPDVNNNLRDIITPNILEQNAFTKSLVRSSDISIKDENSWQLTKTFDVFDVNTEIPSGSSSLWGYTSQVVISEDGILEGKTVNGMFNSAQHFGDSNLYMIRGLYSGASLSGLNSKADRVIGAYFDASMNTDGEVGDMYGSMSRVRLNGTGAIDRVFGHRVLVRPRTDFEVKSPINKMYGYYAGYNHLKEHFSGTIGEVYDFYAESGKDVPGITKKYGIYITGDDKVNYFSGKVAIGPGNIEPEAYIDAQYYSAQFAGRYFYRTTTPNPISAGQKYILPVKDGDVTQLEVNRTYEIILSSFSETFPTGSKYIVYYDNLATEWIAKKVSSDGNGASIRLAVAPSGNELEIWHERDNVPYTLRANIYSLHNYSSSGTSQYLFGLEGAMTNLSGNIGVDNENPMVKLDVKGQIRAYVPGSSSRIFINADADKYSILRFTKSDVNRWDIGSDNNRAETGSDVGTDFYISSASDDGSTFYRRLTMLRENGNMAIGNHVPTEKLDVAGSIKSTALAGVGNRVVFADQDGKLVIGANASSMGLWANNTSAGLVELKATSDGSPRTSTPTGSRNDVTIDNDGQITARSFIGYNGATVFPDYVFEKYYTGESTIKADYNFHNLASIESFIKTNGYLPGYTSAKEIAEKGLIDIGATQLTNVEKIEELYLHTIEQEKAIKSQKEELKAKDSKIEKLEKELNEQKMRLERLEKLLTK